MDRAGNPEKTDTYQEKTDSRGGILPSGKTKEFFKNSVGKIGYPYAKKKKIKSLIHTISKTITIYR